MTHMNPATQTPPVDCPLLIRLPDGRMVREVIAIRWSSTATVSATGADFRGHILEGAANTQKR